MVRWNRAVSEVIASLVLLLIVTILGTTLYSYTLTELGTKQNGLQMEIQMETERVRERFTVIAVWWGDGENLLNMTILNYGIIDIKIVDIYVNGERATEFHFGRNKVIYTITWRRISFISPVPIYEDALYEIVVVSERGVSNVYKREF